MITTTAKSIGKYLNVVDKIRQQWKVEKHLELWFRAEELRHHNTRLQPGLYRPRDDGKRKPVNELLESIMTSTLSLIAVQPNCHQQTQMPLMTNGTPTS
jgi:hypothetical protein